VSLEPRRHNSASSQPIGYGEGTVGGLLCGTHIGAQVIYSQGNRIEAAWQAPTWRRRAEVSSDQLTPASGNKPVRLICGILERRTAGSSMPRNTCPVFLRSYIEDWAKMPQKNGKKDGREVVGEISKEGNRELCSGARRSRREPGRDLQGSG